MIPSSKRKGISRKAYELLMNVGFTEVTRSYTERSIADCRKNPVIVKFEEEYSEPSVEFYVLGDFDFWMALGSFKSGITRGLKLLAWGSNPKRYIPEAWAIEIIAMYQSEMTNTTDNQLDKVLSHYMDIGYLPVIDLCVIKELHWKGFSYGLYYPSVAVFKKTFDGKKEAILKAFPLSKIVPEFKEIKSPHGLHFFFEESLGVKKPIGWVVTNLKITLKQVHEALKTFEEPFKS